MKNTFPLPITELPRADINLEGVTAFLSQAENHQILFMQFEQDVNLPEHSHKAQVGFVLNGRIDLVIDGQEFSYQKGDHYFIPEGVKHSAKIYAGYSDITFFDEPHRYDVKEPK